MKSLIYTAALACLFIACKTDAEKDTDKEQAAKTETQELAYASFGEQISPENTLTAAEVAEEFGALEPGDTISTNFTSTVNSVCKMKGCWMTLEVPGEEDVNVKFKDYGFFVPKDIEGKEVVVEGKAYLKEVSIEDQKHFAKDAGKSEEEIAAIITPKQELAFMANGVLLKQ